MAKSDTKSIDHLKVVDPPVVASTTGGSGGGSDIDSRVARLESDVSNIRENISDIKTDVREIKRDAREDFRWILAVIAAATLGLAAIMATGFGWIG